MIHPKTPSPSYNQQRRKRVTKSGRTVLEPPQTIHLDEKSTSKVLTDVDDADTLGFFELLEKERAEAEMAKLLEKSKNYPIAPDALIPNSTLRSMFRMKKVEPVEIKMFRLRMIAPTTPDTSQNELDDRLKRYAVLANFDGIHSTVFQLLNKIDILDNLQNKTNKNLNWQNDDDEWVELGDPDDELAEESSKPSSAKKSKHVRQTSGTLISLQKDTIPELFRRMQNEAWWNQTDENKNSNLRSMLLYLIEIIKAKETDSYESACSYVVNIFRTYGIEPSIMNHIIGILLDHLSQGENDPLNVHTVRTIAQFMIERKDIIVPLLDFTLKCEPDNTLRLETINAIKFITDVNNTDDIDLVLNNIQVAHDASEDTFSLKTVIERIKYKQSQTPVNVVDEGKPIDEAEVDVLHPLLKKISEERWYPRDNTPITLDAVIDAILAKLPNATKSTLKTLTTHLVQLNRVIGYSNEQFDRVSNGVILLLSHNDADYRLVAATVLADLGKETKAIDLALLTSFINDPRILVRTECCDTLKRLTSIMSDTVLKDCADDIPHLQTLPEENFSLQGYLKKKNHVLTPPPSATDDHPPVPVDEENRGDNQEEELELEQEQEQEQEHDHEQEENLLPIHEDKHEKSHPNVEDSTPRPQDGNEEHDDNISIVRSRTPSPRTTEQQTFPKRMQDIPHIPSQFSITPSSNYSTAPITPVEPKISVKITSDGTKSTIPPAKYVPKSRKELSHSQPPVPTTSQTPRLRKQQTSTSEKSLRTQMKTTLIDHLPGKRQLRPNNPEMWDSYAKQSDIAEENKDNEPSSTENDKQKVSDPIQSIIDGHKRIFGYFRILPNRRVLVPHKISFDDAFSDQIHLTVDRRSSSELTSATSSKMHLADLNRNKHHLYGVEFVQLLSSLVIRSIQLHRRNAKCIPGSEVLESSSAIGFTDALSISQMQLHSSTNLQPASFFMQNKLPPIEPRRPSSAETARMKSDALSRATRTGVNLSKAKDMEDSLSNLLRPNRDRTRTTLPLGNTPAVTFLRDHNGVTHAWILENLLRSQGAVDSHTYIQQIVRTYPKFAPLLYSRVPDHLISFIWNDPVMRQLASIISNKSDDSSIEDISTRRGTTKTTIPAFDDEHSSNFFDYTASSQILAMQHQQRDDHKSDLLPPVRGVKMRLPRHVLKFGFRELESESPEESLISLRDESTSKPRRRRIYMHLMMSVNENLCIRHEMLKSQLRQMLKTDSRTTSYVPFVSRSLCN
ncbi:unnamed protein product [Rotaria magnacalcarata]|uniref:Uncharacterized protein n=2 Tax=Rotaria magnacalcarata TaxID=392030 RepID=A0A816Y5E4_9BILA|nr:unnamed protein product [Rotaria magnacalcarata]